MKDKCFFFSFMLIILRSYLFCSFAWIQNKLFYVRVFTMIKYLKQSTSMALCWAVLVCTPRCHWIFSDSLDYLRCSVVKLVWGYCEHTLFVCLLYTLVYNKGLWEFPSTQHDSEFWLESRVQFQKRSISFFGSSSYISTDWVLIWCHESAFKIIQLRAFNGVVFKTRLLVSRTLVRTSQGSHFEFAQFPSQRRKKSYIESFTNLRFSFICFRNV